MNLRARTTWFLAVGVTLVACALTAAPASASTVRYRTDAELIALSERVVHARVLRQHTARPAGKDGAIYTVTTLAVLEDLTGVEGELLDVWELGGVSGDELMWVAGQVDYRVGSEVLVCLERGRLGLRSVAMGFSKFDIADVTAPDGRVERRLARNMRQTDVLGGGPPQRERTLDEFRALAEQVRGVRSRRNIAGEALAAEQPASDQVVSPEMMAVSSFTLLTFNNGLGARWYEADSGTPVKWYKNTAAPPPLVSGDGVSEIQTALAAWTDPPSASLILQYAGTTNQSAPDGPWSGLASSGTGVISFEDPYNEISVLTLSLGGGFALAGDGRVTSGTLFNRFTRGFVIFQNAATLDVSFRQSQNFARLLEHELGHTIGLDHTLPPSNIMVASCCSSTTPVAPALGPDDLAGLNFIYPLSSPPPACSFSLSTSSTSVTAGGASGTLTVSAASGCSWTAATNASFVTLTPSSGSGSGSVTYSVSANTSTSQRIATLTIAGQTFTIVQAGAVPVANRPPFGVVDTPLDNTTGVAGSIPVTGWALDDAEVASVKIYRDAVAGEPAGAVVYVGDAVFVAGARPDVAAAYPTTPFNTRAGWGYLLLTNVLQNLGTGTFRLHVYAFDRNGSQTLLGSRTITCANSTATTPFGAIDTPAQGETITTSTYDNFGWVLALGARRADVPGSGTVTVVIDGVPVGTPVGWTSRSDLAALFPVALYSGVNTALGVFTFDTSALANGLHTIAWSVIDNQGGAAGVGSRYFTVSQPGGVTLSASAASHVAPDIQQVAGADESAGVPLNAAIVTGRRGFSFDAPLRRFRPDASGRVTVQAEEIDRIELHLGGGSGRQYSGYMRVRSALEPLPTGSTLDSETGAFTWQPGVGFVGSYDFVFIEREGSRAVARQEVRVVLNPKGSGRVGPQVVIDTPTRQQDAGQPFVLAGWAVDLDSETGTGIDTLHVWAYPLAGGDPIFLGAADYGGVRADVAAVYGDQFRDSGYGLVVQGLQPGNYDLAVFGYSTAVAGFVPAKTIRVTVR